MDKVLYLSVLNAQKWQKTFWTFHDLSNLLEHNLNYVHVNIPRETKTILRSHHLNPRLIWTPCSVKAFTSMDYLLVVYGEYLLTLIDKKNKAKNVKS